MLRAPLIVVGSIIMAFFVQPYLALFLVIGAPFLVIFLYIMSRKGMTFWQGTAKCRPSDKENSRKFTGRSINQSLS